MGKPIKITKEHLKEARLEFEALLKEVKLSDGKINFTKTFGGNDSKTTVYYTPDAYVKMIALVNEFKDEVAWHGLARRSTDPDGYIIYDILVYPQEVTGATVNTDQEKFQTWLMNHEDDVFNNIRMQGHSHVNMGVSPSGVDTTLYNSLLAQLDDDMFYIFTVWNKKFESHTKIYDLQKNILYENCDVETKLLDGGIGLNEFITEAKKMVSKKTTMYSYDSYTGNTDSKVYDNRYNPETFNKNKKDKIKTKVGGEKHDNKQATFDDEDYSAYRRMYNGFYYN